MGDDSSRRALEDHLASLLGFDEVSDVFEHLLTIEEEDDLSEYLSALLGLEGEAVSDFVQDMSRFQRGEKLVNISAKASMVDEEESKATAPTDAPPSSAGLPQGLAATTRKQDEDKMHEKMTSMKLEDEPKSQKQNQSQKSKGGKSIDKRAKLNEKRMQKQQKKEKLASVTATEAVHAQESDDKNAAKALASSKSPKSARESKRNETPKPPQRGTASKVCGCFGTVHKPLTNCLHCGRIACETEGYDYCGFCGYLIEKVTAVDRNSDGKFDKALLHKERLLKYDREFTKRTHVYDDQADYFSNTTSVWLDENERNDAEEKDSARQKDIHERKKQTLSLDF